MARNNLRADMITRPVPHQANKRIIESAAERMRLPMERVSRSKVGSFTLVGRVASPALQSKSE